MKKLFVAMAALFACSDLVCAATYYLLVQGPFGSGGAVETSKWQVNSTPGSLSTGQDLLNAVFGVPVLDGTYTDPINGTYPHYVSGDAAQGVGYLDYPFLGLLQFSFTLNSTEVATDNNFPAGTSTKGWNYYAAGGSGTYGPGPNYTGGPYPNDSWTLAGDGLSTRQLADGSFDGWVFGNTGYDINYNAAGLTATIAGSGNTASAPDFLGASVINIPEPAGAVLFLTGAAAILAWKGWRRG